MRDSLKHARQDPVVGKNMTGYVSHCLAPAVVHRLISEDLGQSSEVAARIQKQTAELGNVFNEDDVVKS
jgi:RTC4-like domain